MRIWSSIILCVVFVFAPLLCAVDYNESDRARMRAVTEFVNNVLTQAADRYHTPATPLLADGVHLETKAHLKWRFSDGTESVISSLSSQQNFLRVLVAMSALTGEPRYEKVARDNIAYYFAHYQEPSGLLQWGSHRFVDLQSLKVVGPLNKELVHELKSALPYYELMYKVNPEATQRFISGFWGQHVLLGSSMSFDRHGHDLPVKPFSWEGETACKDEVLIEGVGLTFINTGDDLIYSAAMLGVLTNDARPWQWGCRLAGLYYKARDPRTQLGVYQFTNPKQRVDPATDKGEFQSWFGDRATRQFGVLDGFQVTESSVLFATSAHAVYGSHSLLLLNLADLMKGKANPYVEWTGTGLKAFAKYAYLPEKNLLKPILTNGRDMSGYRMERDGYFGKTGRQIEQYPVTGDYLLAYVKAYCAAPDPELWSVIRSMAKGLRVGDLGDGTGKEIAVQVQRSCNDPILLFALLDLYKKTGRAEYLDGARKIGDNIIDDKFRNGFFVNLRRAKFANIDAIEPLALVALEAAIRGKSDLVPKYIGSGGFIHGEYLIKGDKPRNIVDKALYIGVDREEGPKK